MHKNIVYNMRENLIAKLSCHLEEYYLRKGRDMSKIAFVFEGKRPSLFLNKKLSEISNGSFMPPAYFSIDEFVRYTLSKKMEYSVLSNMESSYMLFSIAKDTAPEILKDREQFSKFISWSREISNFIDFVDKEDISREALLNIQASADIGYEIPQSINLMLKNIILMRNEYHKKMVENKTISKGLIYLLSSRYINEINFDEYDAIYFCGLFYMQTAEQKIIKSIYESGRAVLVFQGDSDEWPTLKNNSKTFGVHIKPPAPAKKEPSPVLCSAFDKHSQICAAREMLRKTKDIESTVVVLPDPGSVIPLISELGKSYGDFNISLGYPLKRSALYHLLELVFRSQITRKDTLYYAKDYINTLNQPIAKNLRISANPAVTRIIVHKIEESLTGMEESPLSGSIFINLKDVEKEKSISELAHITLKSMGIDINKEQLSEVLSGLHRYMFGLWENIFTFKDLARALGCFLDLITEKSMIDAYPLNLKIAERLYSIRDELEHASFSDEIFEKEDIFKIFTNMFDNEKVSFRGSPLKGLQILGTMETRNLNFDNVLILDANESILPKLRISEPLIPREILMNLGHDIIAREEEIQRYNFTRLLSSAKNSTIIYEETSEKEKSRFIEEIIWKEQKSQNKINVIPIYNVSFATNILPSKTEIKKTENMTECLKRITFSASGLNQYINCPLSFYYKYVLGLKERDSLLDDPEAKEIGTFIHNLLEHSFSKYINKKPVMNNTFVDKFHKSFDMRFTNRFQKRMHGEALLLKTIMRHRLNSFLEFERTSDERRVKEILYLEEEFHKEIKTDGNTYKFMYIVDRVDKMEDDSVLILDYKTGSDLSKPKSLKSLGKLELTRESIRDKICSFQLPLYYYFEKKKYNDLSLNTCLYDLRRSALIYLTKKPDEIEKITEISLTAAKFILKEITDPKIPISADPHNETKCRYCSFFYTCR